MCLQHLPLIWMVLFILATLTGVNDVSTPRPHAGCPSPTCVPPLGGPLLLGTLHNSVWWLIVSTGLGYVCWHAW